MAAHTIYVGIDEQQLVLTDKEHSQTLEQFSVSTAKNGVGSLNGSECTPLGRHRIRAKIGAECAINTVFISRRPSGEIYSSDLATQQPQRDWILTRILWLCGEEVGRNRLGTVDTQRRYIYIHGAPDSHDMGVPSSHGCIKMRNSDVITLFSLVEVGTPVIIQQSLRP